VLAAVLLAGAAGCSSGKSYDEVVKGCQQALKVRPKGVKAKPDACKGVKQDDYDTLLMVQVLQDTGLGGSAQP
jgi:uncharacterized lipoprotein